MAKSLERLSVAWKVDGSKLATGFSLGALPLSAQQQVGLRGNTRGIKIVKSGIG